MGSIQPADPALSPLERAEKTAGMTLSQIRETFVPQTDAQLLLALFSWRWRIFSGCLYKITTKGDDAPDDQPEIAVPFKPNRNQRALLDNLHERNVILKARQMGFSTLIEILALDHALFNKDQEVVVIAHTKDAATKLYRKKVCFAYDNLPPLIRHMIPTLERSQTQMVFNNGSSIEVTSSARGGTPHFLHISEMGKIAAKFPDKALEITTGSMQGVPKSGLIFVESTAEGQSGAFYDLSKRAERLHEARANLNQADYRFHFFAWWQQPEYRLPIDAAQRVPISAKEHEYFDGIEDRFDTEIDLGQRAWYIAKRDNDFSSTPEHMWREYPSTPEECWQASTDGKYFARVLGIARREGRIGRVPMMRHVPINTFWDLGASDHTAVWCHQRVGVADHWVRFYEASGEGYLHFILWLERLQCVFGTHYLPHDASAHKQGIEQLTSPILQMREIRPSWIWEVVPRIQTIQHGIELVRQDFPAYWFDEEGCKEGLKHIEAYSREWNNRLQCWHDYPRHDDHSHATDALRQKAQAFDPNAPTTSTPSSARSHAGRRRATGLTA